METKLLALNLIITTIILNGIFLNVSDRHFNIIVILFYYKGFSLVMYEKFGPPCDCTGSHFVMFCCF